MPHEVIMPALGMAQKTGLIVAWLKQPGEAVKIGEALMEVETDKSVMVIEAQADGFLTDVRTAQGEAAPVGDVVAFISQSPDGSSAARAPRPAEPARALVAASPAPAQTPVAKPSAEPEPTHQRILASPKARRLAAEQGLDLKRLVAAGARQPYHVSDLATLRALPGARAHGAPQTAPADRRLTARVREPAFTGFCDWICAETGEAADPTSVMAGMAAAALRPGASDEPLIVATEAFGVRRLYADPDRLGLGSARPAASSETPALILRDLRGTAITALEMGGEAAPVLSVTLDGRDFIVTLECAPDQLKPQAAIELISQFAGRLAEPLRHLL